MNGILLCAVLVCANSSDQPLTYKQAHERAAATKRPMLILVGADWCPACRVMKHSTMPAMQRSGQLKNVLFATVDVDAEPTLAAQLMQSSSIPQLVLYAPRSQGWSRMYLQGSQQPSRVAALIERGLQLLREDRALAASAARPNSDSSGAGTAGDE